MTISMYQASVPVFTHMLANYIAVLQKGAAHAEAKKFDPAVLVSARLAPDMFDLARQVQIAADMAKGCGARLAGVEIPRYEDNETSFTELQARIAKTVSFLKGLDPKSIEGSETRHVTLKFPNAEFNFDGKDYLRNFVLPTVHFHITIAYAILRNKGVPLGKSDYFGRRG